MKREPPTGVAAEAIAPMLPTTPTPAPVTSRMPPSFPPPTRRAWRQLVWTVVGLAAVFSLPLLALIRTAWHSDLLSYVLLIPGISGYLIWLRRDVCATTPVHRSVVVAGILAGSAAALLGAHALGATSHLGFSAADQLTVLTLAFVLLVFAATLFWLGWGTVREIAGPVAFLLFTVPPPAELVVAAETALQHGSAWAVEPLFALWGTPILREGLVLTLPGELGPLRLQVAPECSGIHSTIVLVVMSVAAGLLLLRSPWSRAVLIAAVLPIAILRNAMRIFVLGQLSVDLGPHMLHSWLHQQGGPLFFAASLVPVGALFLLLRRGERPRPVPLPLSVV